ncbi:unnamed protein product [Acanthoscelides obtectus]|uniref:Uncharacterized protein n=1 Tax=Acanthoscelides obtectus TaxID=200917 RepID=A0A9P0PG27_ACAOB|nr:unnamed protein product [Acanthoscelides obtectus]CAK1656740.1 hypothetical protein AOBTE_LOCUS19891 [Acanthoscelides obtectus]
MKLDGPSATTTAVAAYLRPALRIIFSIGTNSGNLPAAEERRSAHRACLSVCHQLAVPNLQPSASAVAVAVCVKLASATRGSFAKTA